MHLTNIRWSISDRQPRATQRQGSQASRVMPADYMYYASRLGDHLQTAEGRQGAAPSVGDLAAASENASAHLSPDAFGSITLKRPAVPASVAPYANHTNVQKQSPQPEPALSPLPPSQLLQILSNLFVAGLEKPGELKPLDVSEPAGGPVKVRGLQGLTAPAVPQTPSTADKERRAHCTPIVDVVFALDDIETIWMARDAIRHYVTHLKPAGKARFGVVLCGPQLSFYTALHTHFSGKSVYLFPSLLPPKKNFTYLNYRHFILTVNNILVSFFTFFLLTCIFVPGLLASLEDLQHANTTLDSNRVQMPDTLGYRGDNNPYPPSVSSDFSQIEARCFETAYYMFMSQVNVLIPIHVQGSILIRIHVQGNILILTGVHEGILILIHIQTFYSNP